MKIRQKTDDGNSPRKGFKFSRKLKLEQAMQRSSADTRSFETPASLQVPKPRSQIGESKPKATALVNTEPKVLSAGEANTSWKAETVVHELTGVAYLGIQFRHSLHGMTYNAFDMDLAENPKKLRQTLRSAGATFESGSTIAEQERLVRELVEKIPAQAKTLVVKPGFRAGGTVFVLGGTNIGAGASNFRWSPRLEPEAILGATNGSLADWKRKVGEKLEYSTLATFVVCSTLGSTLPGYFEAKRKTLSELPVLVSESTGINFSGDSGSGKSRLGLIAAGVIGKPQLFDWDFTATSLEERSACRDGLTLVLDDMETYVDESPSLWTQIRRVNQKIPAGQSKGRSQTVADQPYANLTWHTCFITSGPKPIDAIAAELGKKRTKGEIVRYLDIAVPKGNQGGILDNLDPGDEAITTVSSRLMREIETGVVTYYGTAMPAFVKYLTEADRTKLITELWAAFLNLAGGAGWEERVAKKFALAYAAGILAVRAGVVPWSEEWVKRSVLKCYRRAQAGLAHDEKVIGDKILDLAQAVKDRKKFPNAKSDGEPTDCGPNQAGVRTKYKGSWVYALRTEKLVLVAGSKPTGKALIEELDRHRVLMRGDKAEAENTTQLPVRLRVGGKVFEKPRFYVLDAIKLEALGTK